MPMARSLFNEMDVDEKPKARILATNSTSPVGNFNLVVNNI